MTADNPIHFAEILASRLCHDVISPIGAISTGLELFQEVVPPLSVESQEIFDLIFESAKAATLRASMFRAVFSGGGSALVATLAALPNSTLRPPRTQRCSALSPKRRS